MMNRIWSWTKTGIKYGSILYCIQNFGVSIVVCCGHSMENTLSDKDVILVDRFSLRYHEFNEDYLRNKVVICRDPRNPNVLVCKRVTWTSSDSGFFTHRIPKGCVYLMGDSRNNSKDSRDYGPVPIGLIQGVVIFRIWPSLHKIV